MNKAQLISEISVKAGSTKKDAARYLDAVIETITEALTKHEKITLVGFGVFETHYRDARIAHNPQDGTEVHVPETYIPKFRASNDLKNAVKNA